VNSQIVEVSAERAAGSDFHKMLHQAGKCKEFARAIYLCSLERARTDWLTGVLLREDKGFILTGPDLMPDGKRRLAGRWIASVASGSVRTRSVRRGDVRYRP